MVACDQGLIISAAAQSSLCPLETMGLAPIVPDPRQTPNSSPARRLSAWPLGYELYLRLSIRSVTLECSYQQERINSYPQVDM